MTSIVCGPATGEDGAMRCPCCGFESHNPEAFAVSLCWPCGFGGNLECANCVAAGVWVDRFSSRRGRGHRLRHVIDRGDDAVTACGLTIPYRDIGQATAVRSECRHCWPIPIGDSQEPTDG